MSQISSVGQSAWRDRNFRIFALGNGINTVGESMYALAVPLLVFQLTGSLSSMALLAAAYPIVIALSGPFLGAAVDRFGSKYFVLPGLLLQIVAALSLNLLLLAGAPHIAFLFVVEIAVQLGAVAYRAGWMAGLPIMFPDNASRARGALSTTFQAAVVTGPALAAGLVSPLGIQGLLWLNLATFFPPIIVWFIGLNPTSGQRHLRSKRWSVLADLREGWRLLRNSDRAYVVIVILIPLNFVFNTGTVSLLIFYLRDSLQFSQGQVGGVVLVANVAALGGAALVSEWPRGNIGIICIVGLLGTASSLFVIPATTIIAFAIVSIVALYFLNTTVEVAADMVIYADVPVESIGRSLGFYRLILGVPSFLGPLVIAGSSSLIGTRAAFIILGLVALLPGLILVAKRNTIFSSSTAA